MDFLCQEYLSHYHTEDPHQGRDHELLMRVSPGKKKAGKTNDDLPTLAEIRCRSRLGGPVKVVFAKEGLAATVAAP